MIVVMTRVASTVLGVLLLLIGVVWTLQGANVLPGSFMTGSRFWLGMGILCLVAGGLLIWWVVRGRRTPRP